MEADWEFEVGGDAPIIEAHWPGFVDLREDLRRAAELTEARLLQGLADALVRMNATNSPVWTSKTDVFDPGRLDADELDATREEAQHAIACYVDLLMRSDQQWNSQFKAEQSCREVCARLREIPLRCCRVDLVVRRALIEPERDDLGATAYLTACGRTDCDARSRLAECLAAFAAAIVTGLE
ncbi:MAG: hypothetical protein WCA10_16580 [Terracidiphilus sp.]